jgi:CheY-like chemotaxis protein
VRRVKIVLFSVDLMLLSAAQGVADRQRATLVVTGDARAAVAAAGDAEARLAAIDLRAPGLDVGTLVAGLRSARQQPIHVLAGGPHVHEASLAAARAAGCDEVVTRGEFERRLDAAVERLISSKPVGS